LPYPGIALKGTDQVWHRPEGAPRVAFQTDGRIAAVLDRSGLDDHPSGEERDVSKREGKKA